MKEDCASKTTVVRVRGQTTSHAEVAEIEKIRLLLGLPSRPAVAAITPKMMTATSSGAPTFWRAATVNNRCSAHAPRRRPEPVTNGGRRHNWRYGPRDAVSIRPIGEVFVVESASPIATFSAAPPRSISSLHALI